LRRLLLDGEHPDDAALRHVILDTDIITGRQCVLDALGVYAPTRLDGDIFRAVHLSRGFGLLPQVKLVLHLARDPHDGNSKLFLFAGLAWADHDLPRIVHSIEQHSHFSRPWSKLLRA